MDKKGATASSKKIYSHSKARFFILPVLSAEDVLKESRRSWLWNEQWNNSKLFPSNPQVINPPAPKHVPEFDKSVLKIFVGTIEKIDEIFELYTQKPGRDYNGKVEKREI